MKKIILRSCVLTLAMFSSAAMAGPAETVPEHPAPQSNAIPADASPQAETLPQNSLAALEQLQKTIVPVDAAELPPLHLSLDKAEVIQLDRDAVNILVGSDKNLRVVPDTNRTLVLVPKQPGSTYIKAVDADGKIIMQRHVIVGSPKSNYIRIRRACLPKDTGCKQYSVYYCPDMCHEVSVVQGAVPPSPTVPQDAPSYNRPDPNAASQNDGIDPNAQGSTAPSPDAQQPTE